MHFHYVWKNGFKTVFYDTLQAGAYTRMVSPGYFSVFGVKGADGCSPEELSKRARPEEMVMTDNLARYRKRKQRIYAPQRCGNGG
jgi:putative ABC transport system permease protein